MRLLAGTSVLPIGVDIGQRHIRAVQLKGSPGRWSISAVGFLVRENPGGPVDSTDADQLRNLIAKGGFKGRRVVLAVPCKQLLTGIMELPPRSSGAPLDQLARNELSRLHRCEPDSFEILIVRSPVAGNRFIGGKAQRSICPTPHPAQATRRGGAP